MIFFQNLRTVLSKIRDASHVVTKSELRFAVIIVISLIVIGSVSFRILENWSWLDSIYATIITITTVGYGDLSPQTTPGRIFAAFFTLTAIALAGYALSMVAAYVIDRRQAQLGSLLRERKMKQISELSGHMILCGGGYLGKRVANEFYTSDVPFIIIEPHEDVLRWTLLYLHGDYVSRKIKQHRDLSYLEHDTSEFETMDVVELGHSLGVLFLQEDPTQDRILLRAGIERAKGLVVAMDDDRDNLFAVLSARQLARRMDNSNLRIIVRVVNEENSSKLQAAGADKVVSPNVIGGLQMASHMLHPELGAFWDHMLYQDDQMLRFAELHINQQPELAEQTVADIKEQRSQLVIAIKRDGKYQFMPDAAEILIESDILIVLGIAKGRVVGKY